MITQNMLDDVHDAVNQFIARDDTPEGLLLSLGFDPEVVQSLINEAGNDALKNDKMAVGRVIGVCIGMMLATSLFVESGALQIPRLTDATVTATATVNPEGDTNGNV